MSEARTSRLPIVALSAAVLAVAVSIIAAIIVVTRDDAASTSTAKASGSAAPGATSVDGVLSQRVDANEAYQLRDHLEVVTEAGMPKGLRVSDGALAKTLGLAEGDVIVAIAGRPVTAAQEVNDVLMRAGTMRATTLYVEVDRATSRVLLRWELDGSLLDARRSLLDSQVAKIGALGSAAPIVPSPPPGTADLLTRDPVQALVDQIETIDDTHARVPRATFDGLLANPTILKSMRVVPAVKNGQFQGYKLYAIRPDSPFKRLGFTNGDTVQRINDAEVKDIDDLLMWLADAKRKATTFRVDVDRRGKPVTIHIEIAK